MARIYLASSWRNKYHFDLWNKLVLKHQVYNFKGTLGPAGKTGPQPTAFSWAELDPHWEDWDTKTYRDALYFPRASQGYLGDLRGMEWADTCVLLLPCGRSAHLEAGYMKGRSKRLIIYIPERQEPDLMYLLADNIVLSEDELFAVLENGRS